MSGFYVLVFVEEAPSSRNKTTRAASIQSIHELVAIKNLSPRHLAHLNLEASFYLVASWEY